jgi:hypothetical protein
VGIRDYAEGAWVLVLFAVGTTLETFALERSRRSVEALMELAPDGAHILIGRNHRHRRLHRLGPSAQTAALHRRRQGSLTRAPGAGPRETPTSSRCPPSASVATSSARAERIREKAHGRRRRPFHPANVRKVRENAEVTRRLVEDEKSCKPATLSGSSTQLKIVVSRFESGLAIHEPPASRRFRFSKANAAQ